MTEEATIPKTTKQRGLRRSSVCKSLMVLTGTLAVIGMTGGGLLTYLCAENGVYTQKPQEIGRQSMEDNCQSQIFNVQSRWQDIANCMEHPEEVPSGYIEQLQQALQEQYAPEVSNFEFIIRAPDDSVLFECFTDSEYRYTWTEPIYTTSYETERLRMTPEAWSVYTPPAGVNCEIQEVWVQVPIKPQEIQSPTEPLTETISQTETPFEVQTIPETTASYLPEDEGFLPAQEYREELYYDVTLSTPHSEFAYSVTGYVREQLTADDRFAKSDWFFRTAYNYRYIPPIILGVSIVLFLVSVGFLLWAAGWHRDSEEPHGGVFEKIPYDVFTCVLGFAGLLLIVVLDEVIDHMAWIVCIGFFPILWLLVLWWLVSTAVRIRTKTILSNNLIVILAKGIAKSVQNTFRQAKDVPMIHVVLLSLAGFIALHLLSTVMLADGIEFGLVILILLYTAVLIAVCAALVNMHQLQKGAQKIAQGELNYQIPEEKLILAFRQHGRYLNSISDGMNHAVSERMKSEHFKTELIANVSHDIRTPLTSIINYTDLLSKLELQDTQAQEYIDVLSRQSAKLRKLTEDVLEASKATTGNLKVEKEKMDLRVLVTQIQGEYAERLEQSGLHMVCTMPEEPLYIMADGRLMWRVMENLFSNVCKYAMQGTRVYLDAAAADGTIMLTLRNISAVQLHMSADALMERFVQGDTSRNAEGSGLGLSIAQSLTTLQGGKMHLHIDGDLFKAELVFPQLYHEKN